MERQGNTGFDGIAEMLLQQKKLMEALEAENRELRRQLTDLRRGIGIAVVIEGKTIQLATGATTTDASLPGLQTGPSQPAALAGSPTMAYPQRTAGQPAAASTLNGDRRDNGATRNPLADSFVL